MHIINTQNYEEMSQKGADILLETIRTKNDAIICLATGSSPKRMYELFVDTINKERIDLTHITFVKLDEWYGGDPDYIVTCSAFLKENLLDKLYMQPGSFIEFDGETDDLDTELHRVEAFLNEHPIDVMVLGLGMDGHLGLNEPNESLTTGCHFAKLHEKTANHDMVKGHTPKGGITIGMKGIFDSGTVLMLVTGEKKEDAYEAFMSQRITTQVPSSLLWLHKNCITLIDKEQFPDK